MELVEQRSLTSSNPILGRPQFTRRCGEKTAAKDTHNGVAVVRDLIRAGKDLEAGHEADPVPLPFQVGDLMTMEAVVTRAAVALGATVLMAVLSWIVLPLAQFGGTAPYGLVAAAVLVVALVLTQYRRNRPSMAMTLAFAATQGLFLGILSWFASIHVSPGVFVQTVLATMTACAGVLLAHGLHWVRADRRFLALAGAALIGLTTLAFADWMLYPLMGLDGLGLHPVGLGVFMALVGTALGISLLPLHLSQVKDGVTYGAPYRQAWAAAFGLNLSLVWLYVEFMRLLTLNQGDDLY